MKKLLVLLLVSAMAATGCKNCINGEGEALPQLLHVEGFKGIRVTGDIDVIVSQGTEFRVEGDFFPNTASLMNTTVTDSVWNIEYTQCVDEKTEIRIVVPELSLVEVLGSGDVSSNTNFNTPEMRMTVTGSGNISLIINTQRASSEITGSGNIDIKGSTVSHQVTITGSGNVSAMEFKSMEAEVDIQGSGDAEVSASSRLKASVTGSGNVKYEDLGAKVESEITGSGEVVKK